MLMLVSTVFLSSLAGAEEKQAEIKKVDINNVDPVEVLMKTNMGEMVIRLNPEKAPATVKNFLSYVDDGFYNNLVFHRVISNFMIQGGGMTADMTEKSTKAPIKNESYNGLSNRRGTIAMARTSKPDTASSQFFINVVNNNNLNYRAGRPGYAVFGEVIKGLEVMDRITQVKTGRRGRFSDVPVEAVTLLKVERLTVERLTVERLTVERLTVERLTVGKGAADANKKTTVDQ